MGQVLVAKYGQQKWLLQLMEMVQASVDRGIKQLSGTAGPTENAIGSLDAPQGYAMPARTREEVIKEDPNIVRGQADIAAPANQQIVTQGMQQDNNDMFALLSAAADPATQHLGHGLPGQAQVQPMQETPSSPSGLVLPNGSPAVADPAPVDSGWLM